MRSATINVSIRRGRWSLPPCSCGASTAGAQRLAPPNSQSVDQIIANSGKTDDKSFCGTKPIVLGIHDGFGINGWSKTSMAAVRSEAAKCPNVKQMVRIGQGDLQKSITDVNDMVAQGIDALVLIPDFGKAQLPSIKAATDAGVKVVPWAADPGGRTRQGLCDLCRLGRAGDGPGVGGLGCEGDPRQRRRRLSRRTSRQSGERLDARWRSRRSQGSPEHQSR